MVLLTPIPKSLPALSPLNVTARAGDFASDSTLSALADALGRMDKAYRSILQARAKHLKNPMRTRMANLEAIHDYAWKATKPTLRTADLALALARHEMTRLETEMVKPLKDAAGRPLSVEVRQHLKALPEPKRSEFVMEAIGAGDEFTVGAVLGAPSYLSGLRREAQKMLVGQWRATQHPKLAAKARALADAIEKVELGGKVMIDAVSSLVDVNELKAAKEAAKAATEASQLPD